MNSFTNKAFKNGHFFWLMVNNILFIAKKSINLFQICLSFIFLLVNFQYFLIRVQGNIA